MKIEGWQEISHEEWRSLQKETLHVIHQDIEENGCKVKKVLYYKKASYWAV